MMDRCYAYYTRDLEKGSEGFVLHGTIVAAGKEVHHFRYTHRKRSMASRVKSEISGLAEVACFTAGYRVKSLEQALSDGFSQRGCTNWHVAIKERK